jgi:hypothetical protein
MTDYKIFNLPTVKANRKICRAAGKLQMNDENGATRDKCFVAAHFSRGEPKSSG